MPVRRPLARLLRWLGVLCVGVLALVGGLGLPGPGLTAVVVAGLLAACIAVGIVRDAPGRARSMAECAVQAGAWTVALLLALTGLATLAGGLVALLVGGIAAATWLTSRTTRPAVRPARPSPAPSWPGVGVEVLLLPVPPPEEPSPRGASTMSALSTPALGQEWLRTTAALAGRLTPTEREALVRRRQDTLDELERRDPAGFARWLAAGPAPGSDPAGYVRRRPVQDGPAAETDAA